MDTSVMVRKVKSDVGKVVTRRAASQSKRRMTGPNAKDEVPKPRHPLYGALKGMMTVAEGVDLTEPADPEWADLAGIPDRSESPSKS